MLPCRKCLCIPPRRLFGSRPPRLRAATITGINTIEPGTRRQYTSERSSASPISKQLKRSSQFPPATCSLKALADSANEWTDKQVVLHGYLGTRRLANKNLLFAELKDSSLQWVVQLVSTAAGAYDGTDSPHDALQNLNDHSPVAIQGTVKGRRAPKTSSPTINALSTIITEIEIKVENLFPLNSFPQDLVMKEETVFPPDQRHLQIRNDRQLRDNLLFRGRVARYLRQHLADSHGFEEIETPLLFKSTPEGAREFLVPTRSPGLAYALPQSPQQYKQILMASGIPRYMQLARCFRDEDLRADRQPEFTQLDLEMAFATGEDVMQIVESSIRAIWGDLLGIRDLPKPFIRMTYEEAMFKYGSDKPDVRFGSEIRRIDHVLPVDLVSKLGSLTYPIVDVMKISISDDAKETQSFVKSFMESPDAEVFNSNPDGQPGMFIYDPRRPLQALQAFGFEAAEQLEEELELAEGDLIVLQVRKDEPFQGGSTALGNLRLALHKAAIKYGFLKPPEGFAFLWVHDFPLFTPTTEDEIGQGGSAGISSTHHPFTAPKSEEDIELLSSRPLEARADHYDLVVNGIELGGGSRRIHIAEMQEYVMRQVLGMDNVRLQDFRHLLEVLRAGCPPHAGMALGFDRLVAVMVGKESVRDVIAFPKSGRGEDMLVRSPTRMTEEQLETYGLRLRGA